MKLLLIMCNDSVIGERTLKSRDEVSAAITGMCEITTSNGNVWIECGDSTANSAVYIDTEAGTCVTFKLIAKVFVEVITT